MKKSEWNEALNHIDNDIVINFIKQKDILQKKNKTRKIWIRTAAIAACLAIMITAVFIVPMLLKQGSNEEDQIPVWDTPQLSMVDIFGQPNSNSNAGNDESGCEIAGDHSGYEVPDAKYLYIKEMKSYEYLPIYYLLNDDGRDLNEQEFNAFSSPLLQKSEELFNIDPSQYKNESSEDIFSIKGNFDGLKVRAIQNTYMNFFDITKYSGNDSTIEINGQSIRIDEKLSDEEIIASLSALKEMFFDFFGVSFSDVNVVRKFRDYGKLSSITVNFYNENDVYDPFEKNSFNEKMSFNFYFDYDYDKQDYNVRYAFIQYSQFRHRFDERYQTYAQAKCITVEEAVEFVRKGCMFSGLYGKCRMCWEKLNFAEYDFVEIEYSIFKLKFGPGYLRIPYYVFYKEVPENDISRGLYTEDCKVYETVKVPAIEIIGYEDYFAVQKKYKLEISKPSNVTVRNKVKDSYSAGEPVCISLDIINGYYNVYVNDARLDFDNYSSEHLFYNFVMPKQDVVIRIEPKYNVPFSPSKKEKSTE